MMNVQLISKANCSFLLRTFSSSQREYVQCSKRKLFLYGNVGRIQAGSNRFSRPLSQFYSTCNGQDDSLITAQLGTIEKSNVTANENPIPFDRTKFDILVRRRFLFDQSFDIYGGASGLYDLGPIGCSLKVNLIQLWRRLFVLEEHMHEIDCPVLTVGSVFKASGHIDRFTDYLVKDVATEECFRIDHLIKAHLEELCSRSKNEELRAECADILVKLNGKSMEEMNELVQRFNVKSPSGNDLSEAINFNLMFNTQIGPSHSTKCFLRPETAQGMFVNFKRLLDYNNGRLPFSAAQVGLSFRNEISPRGGLLRVREFTQAEIEHFFDPTVKTHLKFKNIRDTEIVLYSAANQMDGENAQSVNIGEAVDRGMVSNESLGYFLARIQQYFYHIGISAGRLRFRQHMNNEMAHYARDCWDAEILTSSGWLECVGCADRSAYDLTRHTKASGVNLVAEKKLEEPKVIEIEEVVVKDDTALPRRTAQALRKYFEKLNRQQHDDILHSLKKDGYIDVCPNDDTKIRLDQAAVDVRKVKKTVYVEEIVPNVIEPSFGIGRILHVVLESSFRQRIEGNSYFAFPPSIAPQKCAILPLSARPEFEPFVERISSHLTSLDISHKIDNMSGSIGRRYVRCDEIGIPFGITVDFDSLTEPHTITLRERDSKSQLRIPIDDIGDVIRNLCIEKTKWTELEEIFPKFVKQTSTG